MKHASIDKRDLGRCLVLGGRGFIGSHLVDTLLDFGLYVRCFDRPNIAPISSNHLHNANFELFEGDFSSEADVSAAVESCDVCFHLISTTLPKSSNLDPVFDIESNVVGTVRLLEQAVKSGVKKIVFVSSGGTVYGVPTQIPIPETHSTEPVCSYGITKLAIEKYLSLFETLHGLDYTILRLANPYGERQRVHASQGAIAVFLGKILDGEPLEIWGDGSVVRDYIHIKDVTAALVQAASYRGTERRFNIGSGRGHSLNEVVTALENATGIVANKIHMQARSFDVPVSVLGIDKAIDLLGWHPAVPFEAGLERFVGWVKEEREAVSAS